MSKSKGNVIAPDVLVNKYGADTVRAYIMFFARWEMGAPWDSQGIEGTVRWMRRVWTLFTDPTTPPTASDEVKKNLRRKVHQTLKRVTRDFENFEFNTIVSGLMELLNEMYKAREAGAVGTDEWKEAQEIYLKMMAPVAPHIAEELWTQLGKPYSIHSSLARRGRSRRQGRFHRDPRSDQRQSARPKSLSQPKPAKRRSSLRHGERRSSRNYLEGKEPRKVIVAKGKLVSLVV
jgi:leucyl-tRNA synthetase